MTWTAFLFAYLFGGLTFLPLLVTAVLAHFYFSSPYREDADPNRTPTDDKIVQPGDKVDHLDAAQKENAKLRSLEPDVAAGYFAVCREYVPMGINAKPIERATPVGSATVAAPSPSVYQTMYRSIFDRKPAPGPLDDKNNISQRPKKAGNVFYVVMRHGHLMLFDDDEQLEVRHVISLAHHDVSLYSGEDETPEGELFIKRNAICLSRKTDGPDLEADSQLSRPFYLFSENCSAKEDFYFALLRNQLQSFGSRDKPPSPLQFDVKNVISLVQKLHSTDDHSQTRWLNALIGRVFLGISKTKAMEDFIREKLEKKLSRVKKPAFLPNIAIKGIDTGDSGPFIMNPRLRDLSVEGDCGVEMDIKYTGKFRIEVAATARIDLGTRFKAREVNLVLAVVVRKLEGHLLLKIKPPPSNRVWLTFQQMPKLDLAIEPIVSSRQITYTVILRQIENRIKEIVAETLVLPFWDDMVFFHTEGKKWRGGIFEENQAAEASDLASVLSGMNSEECEKAEDSQGHVPLQDFDLPPMEKSQSSVSATETEGQRTGLFGRKLPTAIKRSETFTTSNASSTSIETGVTAPPVPRPSRSTTFVQPPTPVTGTDASNAEFFKPSSPSPDESPAIAAMATLSARSRPAAEFSLDSGSVGCTNLVEPHATSKSTNGSSSSSLEGTDNEKDADLAGQTALSRRNTVASARENLGADSPSNMSVNGSIRSQTASLGRAFFGRRDSTTSTNSAPVSPGHGDQKKRTALGAVTDAAASARRWGLGALQRHSEAVQSRNNSSHASDEPLDLNQPIGRGRPLPPPGQPLPMPEKRTTRTSVPVAKRKPVPPPQVSPTKLPLRENGQAPSLPNMEGRRVPPPPLPTRRRAADEDTKASLPTPPRLPPRTASSDVPRTPDAHVLVVAAPLEEETVPSTRRVHQAYVQPWVQDGEESFMDMTSSPADHEEAERVDHLQEKTAVPHNLDTGHGQDTNHRHDQKSRNRQSEERGSIEEDLDDDEFSAWMDNITGPAEPARAVLAGEDFVH